MTWSFQISNGDLVLNRRGFSTITSENKLVQDFRHYLLTHMGSDSINPSYGSLLDGGVRPDGTSVPSVIARTDWEFIKLDIELEIRRIAATYQRQQLDRANADRARYNKTTFTLGEILIAVNGIDFVQNTDALLIRINISTGRTDSINIEASLPPVITR